MGLSERGDGVYLWRIEGHAAGHVGLRQDRNQQHSLKSIAAYHQEQLDLIVMTRHECSESLTWGHQ